MSETIVQALADIVGPTHVVTDAESLKRACLDNRGRRQGHALALVQPASTEEVVKIVQLANTHDLIIVTQGGNTSNVGGATPSPQYPERWARTIVLSTSRMNQIRHIDPVGNTAVVQSGVILQTLQTQAQAVHRLFALSLASEGSAQVGGLIATNAGGVHVLRYGSMHEQVLGLEVVLADATVLNLLKSVRKDNSGYDLKSLFIGSEGTLGIITQAHLKLHPLPLGRICALIGLKDLPSVEPVFEAIEATFGPSLHAFELMSQKTLQIIDQQTEHTLPSPDFLACPWSVLIELDYYDEMSHDALQTRLEQTLLPWIDRGLCPQIVVSQNEQQCEQLWALREGISEAVKKMGGNVKNDICIERRRLVAFMQTAFDALQARFPWLEPAVFGHYGDGNLHFNLGIDPQTPNAHATLFEAEHDLHEMVNDLVMQFNGSIAAEHGVGEVRLEEMMRTKSAIEISIMRKLKNLFDPQNRFNPERLISFKNDY